jgi:hypothetical protein
VDLNRIFSLVMPDPEVCRRAAEALRLENPDATAEQAAERAVKQSRKWAASVGATTGVAASPLTMFPAAIADAAAMLRLEGQLAGTIAALLEPESLGNAEVFRRDVLRCVFPGAVSQALRRLGVRAAEQSTKAAMQKLATRAGSKELTERATRLLGVRLAEKAVASKAVPLVGAGIGAAWNWVEIQGVGRRAIDYHMGRDGEGKRAVKRIEQYLRGKLSARKKGAEK